MRYFDKEHDDGRCAVQKSVVQMRANGGRTMFVPKITRFDYMIGHSREFAKDLGIVKPLVIFKNH